MQLSLDEKKLETHILKVAERVLNYMLFKIEDIPGILAIGCSKIRPYSQDEEIWAWTAPEEIAWKMNSREYLDY